MHPLPLRSILILLSCLTLLASPILAVGPADGPAEPAPVDTSDSWLEHVWHIVTEVFSATNSTIDTSSEEGSPSDPPPEGQDAPDDQDELAGEVVPIG